MLHFGRAHQTLRLVLLTGVLLATIPWAHGVDPDGLQAMLSAGDEVVVIDVRPRVRFTQDHIPGAINIPAMVVEHKRLPAFGRVVVCGDGFDVDATRRAVEALNLQPGIHAEMLEGGFPAWRSHARPSTRGGGLYPSLFELITYQQLEEVHEQHDDLVLVDLRRPVPPGKVGSAEPVTDLGARFPDHPVMTPEERRWRDLDAGTLKTGELLWLQPVSDSSLYVLIDDGDGVASEAVALRLRAKGIERVMILTGGEAAIRSRGEATPTTVETQISGVGPERF